MSGFSAAVKIGDLDDFLSPAADCVILPADPNTKKAKGSVIKQKEEVAAITLSDCLACSGCVTSAETLLLQSQSVDELVSKCSSGEKLLLFTLSSASRRALSTHLNVHPSKVCETLENQIRVVLPRVTVIVVDSSLSEAIVLKETLDDVNDVTYADGPVLTSHCPGWTCYATKVLDDSILKHISRVKSAEQVSGMIFKDLLPAVARWGMFRHALTPAVPGYDRLSLDRSTVNFPQIFHVYISPCFDKKLEIIRPDFTCISGSEKSVDLVLSSTEVIDLVSRSPVGGDPVLPNRYLSLFVSSLSMRDSWAVSEGPETFSGGYAQAAALTESPTWTKGKNSDMFEFKSYMRSYGFRNIQNVTRRVSSGKLKDKRLVEIMACPGGCPRGGGQPVAATGQDKPEQPWWKRWFGETEKESVDASIVDHISSPDSYGPAMMVRSMLVKLASSEEAFKKCLRTDWKGIAPPENPEGGISVSNLKW